MSDDPGDLPEDNDVPPEDVRTSDPDGAVIDDPDPDEPEDDPAAGHAQPTMED